MNEVSLSCNVSDNAMLTSIDQIPYVITEITNVHNAYPPRVTSDIPLLAIPLHLYNRKLAGKDVVEGEGVDITGTLVRLDRCELYSPTAASCVVIARKLGWVTEAPIKFPTLSELSDELTTISAVERGVAQAIPEPARALPIDGESATAEAFI